MIAAGAGLVLGVPAGLLMRIRRAEDGTISSTAGTPYAVLWLVVIGGHVAFAESANGGAQVPVRKFSTTHEITGTDAWTAAFIIMALSMAAARVATSYICVKALPGPAPAVTFPSTLPGGA